jgi:hypothetical protein
MLNLANKAFLCALGTLLALPLQACAGIAPTSPQPGSAGPGQGRLSRLEMVGEGSLGHTLRVLTEPGVIHRATGTVTRDGQTWRASGTDCPPFREQLDAFQRLPPLQLGPVLLLPNASQIGPIAPRRIHGEGWVLRTQLHAPDWSSMDAEMQASSGPYADWASDTVLAIKSCDPSDG